MSTSTSSLLDRIRHTFVKTAAMEWVPDGRGGGSYRDLSLQRAQSAGQSRYLRDFGGRADVQMAQEHLAHRQAMRDGSWLSPGYASRMRTAGRSPESAQTNATLQEIRQLAAKYKMSPQLQNYLMRNPQELAKLRVPAPAARQPVSTTAAPRQAAPVQSAAAPVRQVQQPVAQTQVRQPVQSPAQAVQATPTSSNPLENLLRQGRITQQEFDAASAPNRPRGGDSPLFRLYQQGKLSRRDFDRMTVRPPAAATQARQQPTAPAEPAGGQTTAGLGFGITDADLPKPLGQQTPVQSPATRQYAEAGKNFATGQVEQTAQQPTRQLRQENGQTSQPSAGKTVTTCPTCGGSGKKIAESALPAAPKIPNPAPQPLKTPSFTTRPPTVGKAVADIRPGLAGTVKPSIQTLGTAKARNATQVAAEKPIMAPKEFKAIPTAPLAKTAQSIAFGGGPVPRIDTSKWTKQDWRRYFGTVAAAPLVAASAPALATAGTVGAATGALGNMALAGLGGYGAGTGAFDAADLARRGDYGAAARAGAGAVVSAGFPMAGKIPLAFKAAKGAAGALAATDLARAGAYAYGGMPGAAGGAAAGAIGDLSMFLPGAGLLSNTLRGVGLYGVSPIAGIYEQNAANKAIDARTEKLYGPVVTHAQDVATKVLKDHGVKVGPYADAIAETAQDAAAGAYAVDSDAVAKKLGPLSRFAVGLTGSEDVADTVLRERMVENGITPGGRQAVSDVYDLARDVAPKARAIQDYQASWRGKLDRALGWAGRNKGLLAAGAGTGLLAALVWRALANRRKKRQDEKTVS